MATTGRLGIVAATEIERRWLGRPAAELEISCSGAGRERARRAAGGLVERGACALVSWGSAGGLDPSLASGTVVVPGTVVDADGARWAADPDWRQRLTYRLGGRLPISDGDLICAPGVVATAEAKAELGNRTGGVAVDMESAGVAETAVDRGLPWIAVKVVLDTADDAVPPMLLGLSDGVGRLRLSALFGVVVRPPMWSTLARLARANRVAGRTMRRVAARAPDLARL